MLLQPGGAKDCQPQQELGGQEGGSPGARPAVALPLRHLDSRLLTPGTAGGLGGTSLLCKCPV